MQEVISFTIPEIYCPFPSLISPYTEELEAHVDQFIMKYHLVQQERALQRFALEWYSRFVARVYPLANLDGAKIIAEWIIPAFILDDHLEKGHVSHNPEHLKRVIDHLQAVFSDPTVTPRGPMAEALSAFWHHATHATDASWQKRFVNHHAIWLEEELKQAQNGQQGQALDLESYLEHRRESCASGVVFDLINIGLGFDLPSSVHNSPEIQRLRWATAHIVSWDNDLVSLRKELAVGETNNLVLCLQRAHRCSLQEAIDCACSMIVDESHCFLEISQRLPSFSPEIDLQVRTYVEHLQATIPGNLAWSYETSRYSQRTDLTREQEVCHLESILPS